MFDGGGADGLAFLPFGQFSPRVLFQAGVRYSTHGKRTQGLPDTYDNGCGANPEIQVFSGIGYNECIAGIQKTTNSGNLNFLHDGNYDLAEVVLNNSTVTVK